MEAGKKTIKEIKAAYAPLETAVSCHKVDYNALYTNCLAMDILCGFPIIRKKHGTLFLNKRLAGP